jgi:integration host factor subunit beta
MNKIELIQALKDSNHLSKSGAEAIVNLIFDQMADALAKGDRVEIWGLCSFSLKNTEHTPGGTPKPVRRSRLRRRSCPFSRRARS